MPNEFVSVIKPRASKVDDDSAEVVIAGRAIPVLPVRDTVLFPHAVLPLTVGRAAGLAGGGRPASDWHARDGA